MRERFEILETCLFDAAFNSEYSDHQDERQIWAIIEAFRRTSWGDHWGDYPSARKEHTCNRGCKIDYGHIYFRQNTFSYSSGIKICAGCMAMVLYLQQAYERPVVFYTHWDWKENEPVNLDRQKLILPEDE